MATATTMSRYAPPNGGVRDPRDTGKKNGMFWNWPRFQYLGGAQQTFSQAGDKSIGVTIGAAGAMMASKNQLAVGPITDRGRGRG
jgi:hypothetical protein